MHLDPAPALPHSPMTTAQAPSTQLRLARSAGKFFKAIFPFAVILGVWWAAWLYFDPPEIILVSPATVFTTLLDSVKDGTLPTYIVRSLGRLGLGTLAAILIAVPVGWLLGINADVSRSVEPMLRFFNAVSGIAWLPAMIIWFGFTERTIQAIIIYTMAFPVLFKRNDRCADHSPPLSRCLSHAGCPGACG